MPKKVLQGIIVSAKNANTVIVAVKNTFAHPKYKKIVTKTSKYCAHNPYSDLVVGHLIAIEEHSPFSKTKNWLVKR